MNVEKFTLGMQRLGVVTNDYSRKAFKYAFLSSPIWRRRVAYIEMLRDLSRAPGAQT